jgi:hypothetical protein
MSLFSSMTLTFNKGDHFHSVRVDEDHETSGWSFFADDSFTEYRDHSGLTEVYNRLIGAGFELVSCVIDGSTLQYEALKNLSDHRDVMDLFDALKDSDYDAHTICAWLTVDETANLDNLQGSVMYEGNSYTRIWDEISSEENIPGWVVADPQETCETYAEYNGYVLVDFEGYIYIFSL